MPLGVTMHLHEVTSTWEVTLGLQEVTKGLQVVTFGPQKGTLVLREVHVGLLKSLWFFGRFLGTPGRPFEASGMTPGA